MVQLKPDENHWSKGEVEHKISDRSYMVKVKNTLYRRIIVHIKPRHNSGPHMQYSPKVDALSLLAESSKSTARAQSSHKSVITPSSELVDQDDGRVMNPSFAQQEQYHT